MLGRSLSCPGDQISVPVVSPFEAALQHESLVVEANSDVGTLSVLVSPADMGGPSTLQDDGLCLALSMWHEKIQKMQL